MNNLINIRALRDSDPAQERPSDAGFGIPSGWFAVARSNEIGSKKVKPIHYFGRELVVYRAESGKAVVMNAHCPHGGAHLGYGGEVVGDKIRCPFHGWKFGSDGTCVDIPYHDGPIPPRACIKTWPVRESGGWILVWYSEASSIPDHEPPEWGSVPREWYSLNRFRWIVDAPVQAMSENMVDAEHVPELHKIAAVTSVDVEPKGEQLHTTMTAHARMEDTRFPANLLPNLCRHSLGICYGLGLHKIEVRVGGSYEILVIFTVTPIDENRSELNAYTSTRRSPGLMGFFSWATRPFVHFGLWRELSYDRVVWNHQRYPRSAVLTQSDLPYATYRRWAKQFYTHLKGAEKKPDVSAVSSIRSPAACSNQ